MQLPAHQAVFLSHRGKGSHSIFCGIDGLPVLHTVSAMRWPVLVTEHRMTFLRLTRNHKCERRTTVTDQQLVPRDEAEKFDLIKPHLPPAVRDEYQWHRRENELVFRNHLEAFAISVRFQLPKQVALYAEQIRDLYDKDRTERIHDLLEHHGYRGRYFFAEKNLRSVATFSEVFEEADYSNGYTKKYWHYKRIDKFGQQIPLQALRVLLILEQQGITPEALWVAEKKQDTRRLPDPLLCASFGSWVVTLAAWE